MKHALPTLAIAAAALAFPTSCARENANAERDTIRAFTREEGSGTREAFFEMLGMPPATFGRATPPPAAKTTAPDTVFDDAPHYPEPGAGEDENAAFAAFAAANAGNADRVLKHARVASGTGAMNNAVAANPPAIGYVSLGALRADARALPVNGVAPTPATVTDGTYPLCRNFHIALPARADALALDFVAYALSVPGQKAIAGMGYVPSVDNPAAYEAGAVAGKLRIEGSTSVAPVMQVLADAYTALHGTKNVSVEIRPTSSGAGIAAAVEGAVDLAMSSRPVHENERAALRDTVVIAHDGIAVIVHADNPLPEIRTETIRRIYMGEIARWEDVR